MLDLQNFENSQKGNHYWNSGIINSNLVNTINAITLDIQKLENFQKGNYSQKVLI